MELTGDSDSTKNEMGLLAYRVLLPAIFGLALSATTVNIETQAAHRITSISEYSGGPAALAILPLGLLFLSTFRIKRFTKRFISTGTFLSIHLAGLSSLVLAFISATGSSVPLPALVFLKAFIILGSVFLQFYWLRKLRGTSAEAVAIAAFSAVAISEALTFLLSFTPPLAWYTVAMACTFSQFGTIRISRTGDVPSDLFPAVSETYFGTDENRFSNRSFLIAAATGIWFISIAVGMGRGFPDGDGQFLDPGSRLLMLAIAGGVCVVWIRHALASNASMLTTNMWVVMEVLLALSAMCYATFPQLPGLGAALALASSTLLMGFGWYLAVAFISFGWRDPFYYTSAAWIAMTLFAIAGMGHASFLFEAGAEGAAAVIAFMGFFTLVSTLVVFTRLLSSPTEMGERQAAMDAGSEVGLSPAAGPVADSKPIHITQDDVRRIPLMGVMALSPQNEAPVVSNTPDVHIATSVLEMGRRFGLTGREVEVLALYALGHTQQRVSDELQLSLNTVHTHIKRIYDKTDLHSRQEILDYINEYGSKR